VDAELRTAKGFSWLLREMDREAGRTGPEDGMPLQDGMNNKTEEKE